MDPNANGADGSSGADNQSQESRYSEEDVSKILSEKVQNVVSARLNEQSQKHTQEMNALRDDLKAKPKIYSRADLQIAVSENKITDTEAQSILDKQQRLETKEIAETTADNVIKTRDRDTRTQAEIDRYTAFDPDLNVEGSDSRNRIVQEVQAQMGIMGQDVATTATEHAALRAIYGPSENLSNGKEHGRQTHQETYGGSDNQPLVVDDSWAKDLTPRRRDYYKKQIDSGFMTLDQVKEEVPYINQDVDRRAANR